MEEFWSPRVSVSRMAGLHAFGGSYRIPYFYVTTRLDRQGNRFFGPVHVRGSAPGKRI